MGASIPEVVIRRLPVYARALATLAEQRVAVVSSMELGRLLQVTPAQIRKDLSYFGEFGKQGTGYDVAFLLGEIRKILGLDRQWPMVLIGMGQLGRAVLGYSGFAAAGFPIVAAFDHNPVKVGSRIGSLTIRDPSELGATIAELGVKVGVVAVPAAAAQQVVDTMVAGGVRAILNYAPTTVRVPAGVRVRNIDPVSALQSMTYHLAEMNRNGEQSALAAAPGRAVSLDGA